MTIKKKEQVRKNGLVGFITILLIIAIIGVVLLVNEQNKAIESGCRLLFYYRYENFAWERNYEGGKLISWDANKGFNKDCGKIMDYRFPESLEELGKSK